MKLIVSREKFLKLLQLVSGAVERRQTLPILSNILLSIHGEQLSLLATDLEVELRAREKIDQFIEEGDCTVSARKIIDICRSLSSDAEIELFTEKDRLILMSGKSKFVLLTLPANEFPNIEEVSSKVELSIEQGELKKVLANTHFAMAQQDVRYYLNGMLFEVSDGSMKVVATDGHRLSLATLSGLKTKKDVFQVIIPRKGIIELMRLLDDSSDLVKLKFGANHVCAETETFTFISKLIEGKFPDYDRVIPKGGNKIVIANREKLKQALTRASILSNEKFRGVRLFLTSDELKIFANNPEQEEAEEELDVSYKGADLEIGFNVNYLLDICNTITSDEVKMIFRDPNSSVLVEPLDQNNYLYVVMPMRL